MRYNRFENKTTHHTDFMYDTLYFQQPGDEDWDDAEEDDENTDDDADEDFDDRAQDMDDLHEILANDDLDDPVTEDEDDHFPDDDLQ